MKTKALSQKEFNSEISMDSFLEFKVKEKVLLFLANMPEMESYIFHSTNVCQLESFALILFCFF